MDEFSPQIAAHAWREPTLGQCSVVQPTSLPVLSWSTGPGGLVHPWAKHLEARSQALGEGIHVLGWFVELLVL
jgi:hypothetical protein